MEYNEQQLKDLMSEGATNAQMGEFFGVHERTVRRWKARLAVKGHSPEHDMTRMVPDGYKVKGVSSYYNKNGVLSGQWVKSSQDNERQYEMMVESCNALREELPQIEPRNPIGSYEKDLHVVYPIGDMHVGEYVWARECGKSWDLEIAEKVHCGAVKSLVGHAPASETATIIDLGDAQHFQGDPVTPTHGHILDADGRYAKVIHVSAKIMRQCIESALEKHKHVRVICVPGNHNPHGALWMSLALSFMYEKEPRVTIDTEPTLFRYFEFGKVLIGTHHGHSCKPDKLPAVMAADQAKAWGRTEHRAWYIGHVHHSSVKEYPGCTVESFNALVPGDSYATAGGWRSKDSMKAIALHKEHGEVMRWTVNADMFR